MAWKGPAAVLDGRVVPRNGRLLAIDLFVVGDYRIELGGRGGCVDKNANIFVGDVSGGLRSFVPFLVTAGVNARVASEFVRSRKPLLAVGKVAQVRLLAGMGANMTSLMLKSIERT